MHCFDAFERGIVVRHHYRYAPPQGRVSAQGTCSARLLRGVLGAPLLLRRHDSFKPTELMPYQVKLDKGILIYAPLDEDKVIRAERNQDRQVSSRMRL